MELVNDVEIILLGMGKNVFVDLDLTSFQELAGLVIQDQLTMEETVSVIAVTMEIETFARLVIVLVVNVLDLRLTNVLHVHIYP